MCIHVQTQFPTGPRFSFFEPRHEISINVVCAASKASDQSRHMRSLIRAFASCLNDKTSIGVSKRKSLHLSKCHVVGYSISRLILLDLFSY